MKINLKNLFKYWCIILMYHILKIFWIFPIHKNQILFISYNGSQYSDSPQYLCEYINSREKDKRIVWAFKDETKFLNIKTKYNTVKFSSLAFIKCFCTSGTVVTNNTLNSYLPIRKKQIILQTWHGGGPGKKTGLLDPNADSFTKYHSKIQSKKITAFLSGSKFTSDVLCRQAMGYKCPILEFGTPRSDIFFNNEKISSIKKKVYKYYGIPSETKIVLYAPTFRGEGNNIHFIEKKLYPKLDVCANKLSLYFNCEFVVFTRMHPALKKISFDNSSINADDYPEMQELLCAAEVLITDYSSCMHDFALLRKPCFLYTPDYDEYMKDRGFYWSFDLLPYTYSKSMKELSDQITHFNDIEYQKRINDYLYRLGNFEMGDATEKTYWWLKEKWSLQ